MRLPLAVLALTLLPFGASAQDTQPARIRGTVENVTADTLTVKSRDGETVAIALAPDWGVTGVAAAELSDIKPGDYVGIASLPNTDGRDAALEVLIFPKAMAGTGEGSYPWDLQPESTMTNATVSSVEQVDGTTLKLTYKGEKKSIVVPPEAPIVTFAEAAKTDLVPGATVFVPAQADASGAVTTNRVVVGTNGTLPPM